MSQNINSNIHSYMKKIFLMMLLCCFAMVAGAQDDSKRKQAYDLVTEGVKLYDNEDYKGALKKFDASLKLWNSYAPAYYEKALTLQMMGKFKEAQKVLLDGMKKCEEDENIAMNYKLLADIQDEQGETRKALDNYYKAMELCDGDNFTEMHSIAYNFGVACENMGNQLPDSCEEYYGKAANLYIKALTYKPQHASSYYGFYNVLMNMNASYTYSVGMLGWFGFFGGSHPRIDKLAELPAKWQSLEITPEVKEEFGPKTTALYNTINEVLSQAPSEYGAVYDIFYNAIPKVSDGYTNEPVPFAMLKGDIHDDFLYPLYAKMIREDVFEAFCHVVARNVEKDYIANANWITKNPETVDKLLAVLNDGRYFDPDVKKEQKFGRVPSKLDVSSAEEAHAMNKDAELACTYFLNHYLGTEEMRQTGQFILNWSISSPDVMVPIGENLTAIISEQNMDYMIAYIAACSLYQLQDNTKEITIDVYPDIMSAVLWYYDVNKDRTGSIAEFDRLSDLCRNNHEAFLQEMVRTFPDMKNAERKTE